MPLPSWIDNPLSIAAQRLADAIGAISPVKIDSQLLNQVKNVSGYNNALKDIIKGISPTTNVIPQALTDRIAAIKGLTTNPNIIPADNGSLAALANRLNVSFTADPNPLNQFVTYTYHIRWFMAPEFESFNVPEENPNSEGLTKVIIAESGVTAGINIESLEIDSLCTPDARVRGAWTAQKFRLRILEPLNISLIDRMLAAAKQLRIRDSNKCPYFLEVWFNGYDENGTIIASKLYYQMYRTVINRCDLSSTSAGTSYSFELLADQSVGEANLNSTPPQGVQVTAATVGEFFDKFIAWWNIQMANVNYDKVQRKTYKIEYPNSWRKWTLKNIDTAKQTARSTGFKAETASNQTIISVPKGSSIEAIVNYVLYLSDEAQAWITGEDALGSGQASLTAHGLLRFVTIRAKNKIIGWDTLTKAYTYEITYMLFATESTQAYTDMQTVEKIMQEGTQVAKLQYLAQNGRLRKQYDWIYTGLNTEVLNFNFNINNAWNLAQPMFNQVNNYNQLTVGPVAAKDSVGYQSVLGTLPTGQSARPAVVQNNQWAQQAAANLPGDSYLGALGVKTITDNNQLLTPQQAESQAVRQGDLPASLSPGAAAVNAAQTKAPTVNPVGVPGTNPIQALSSSGQKRAVVYAEDFKNLGQNDAQPWLVSSQFDPAPTDMTVAQGADQNKIAVDPDPGSQRPGAGFIGAIIGNLFSQAGGQFGTIELDIRGDPWWMPLSNIKQNQLASQIIGNDKAPASVNKINAGEIAQFLSGDNLFLFQFLPGIVIDETTGLTKNDKEAQDYFTGLYKMAEVTNRFNGGEFTQRVKAYRDVLSQRLPKPKTADVNRDRMA